VFQAIHADPTTYIQLRPTAKLSLTVGGEAVVIPKVKLTVRCPVEGKGRGVTWRDGAGEELGKRGRVKVSRHGSLRINKVRGQDAGVYTCVAPDGRSTANITLSLHSSEEAMRQVTC
jgi:hypothetical protein